MGGFFFGGGPSPSMSILSTFFISESVPISFIICRIKRVNVALYASTEPCIPFPIHHIVTHNIYKEL